MRLTLVIPSLELGGGAERVLATLASAWAERGEDVTIVLFGSTSGPGYGVSPQVTCRSLEMPHLRARDSGQALTKNLQRVRRLRRVIRETAPDVVISFLDFVNVLTVLATRGMNVPVIVSERSNPEMNPISRIWKLLRRLLYPCADALVCQTSAVLAVMQRRIGVRGFVIPNPVGSRALEPAQDGARLDRPRRTAIAMGRLAHEKGFDLLLDAFARVNEQHPEWSLKVLGEGPLRPQLESQAQSLGLRPRVSFAGVVADPFPELRDADLFVCSSRFEGFPNALAEAMASGLPVISFDCPSGPSDLIEDGVNGVLVPREDVAALATAIDRLMSDAAERARLSQRGPDVVQRFSLERILPMWDEVLDQVRPQRGR